MRQDNTAFTVVNSAPAASPRFVVELSFDEDNEILWYFTSHADAAVPDGASVIENVVDGLSVTSQTLNPDTANAQIGAISFHVIDKNNSVRSVLGAELVLGRSTRMQRVRVYHGYEGLAWEDYVLIQTQILDDITFNDGVYAFQCLDIQRELREDIFDLATTTLQSTLSITGTTINVYDTSAFESVEHGSSYSDEPGETVGYVRIDDEIIRWISKTSTTFTVDTGGRGALGTRAAEHAVDATQTADRRAKVEEVVYLEMPSVKLMYAIQTGILLEQGGATLPARWHLGISTDFVRVGDYSGVGADVYDPTDDEAGFPVRFVGLTKRKGKEFLEKELALLTGVFMPVYADGALGLKRMAAVLDGSAYVMLLDESNVISGTDLQHDYKSMHNVLQIKWNYEPIKKETTRGNVLIDAGSITRHKRAEPLKYTFLGLHGSRHSSTMLARRFDTFRDRYTSPPLRCSRRLAPSCNVLEVGDVVRLREANVQDFVANSSLDRSMEIQNITWDPNTGQVNVKLFASSGAATPIADSSEDEVLPDAWYESEGTDVSTVLTVTGSNPGHVSASGTLDGHAAMNNDAAIYYYAGDLVIDDDVVVTINENVQLRAFNLTVNGTVDGRGQGIAGATAPTISNPVVVGTGGRAGTINDAAFRAAVSTHSDGTAGFLGSPKSAGSLVSYGIPRATFVSAPRDGWQVVGKYAAVPSAELTWDGTTLGGIFTDMRGSSGSSGAPSYSYANSVVGNYTFYDGGDGGAGGAGLCIVTRSLSFGVDGVIDLSGGEGGVGELSGILGSSNHVTIRGGSGAGGGPGGLLVIIDGSSGSATGLTEEGFVAEYGATPIVGNPLFQPTGPGQYHPGKPYYSFYVGHGDGTTFPIPSLSGARGGHRVQFVPSNGVADPEPDVLTLAAPTNLGLASGTNELLTSSDGTIIVRIKVTWTASVDPRTVGYDIRFKRSSDSVYTYVAPVLGRATTTAWISGVRDGINYDVEIRAGGAFREVSDWLSYSAYPVVGKTALPSNVGSLSFDRPFLSWSALNDADLRGYIVRYNVGTSTTWAGATPAHTAGFVTETEFDTTGLPQGILTMLVKSIDRSGNESATAASLMVTVWDEEAELHGLICSNWTERANPKNQGLLDVAWNGSVFCAVGEPDLTDAYIVTSLNGSDWIERSNPKNITLWGITWNGSIFVAVGQLDGTDAYIITSPDGVTWTERSNPKNVHLRDVVWNGSIFVAVGHGDGTDAYIVTSPNGTTWTERSPTIPKNVPLESVAWNGSVFCAVGYNDGSDTYTLTSPDGITWTERSNSSTDLMYDIDWNGSVFCAVGLNTNGLGDQSIATSPDGISWTNHQIPAEIADQPLAGICWNGHVFVAGVPSVIAQTAFITSPDGQEWTFRAHDVAQGVYGIAWNGRFFVAVGFPDLTDAFILTSLSI